MTKTASAVRIQPLGNRVLLQRLEEKEQAIGGIILPDSAKKKQEQAKVIAVGPGKKLKDGSLLPLEVSPGDIVLIEKYAGQECKIDDQEYVITRSDDIIAVIQQ